MQKVSEEDIPIQCTHQEIRKTEKKYVLVILTADDLQDHCMISLCSVMSQYNLFMFK